MNRTGTTHTQRFAVDALHVFALSSFAVAQPLYDILGRNAEFFVAHQIGAGGILVFAAAVSLALPLMLVAIELVARLIAPRAQQVLHALNVFVLLMAFFAPLANKIPGLPAAATLAVAGCGAAVLTMLYVTRSAVRSFATALAFGIPAFPVLFLAFTPVSALIVKADTVRSGSLSIANPAPIVLIVLDEFEAGALLDENRRIDRVRFPNFAALADGASWFPRATAVWTETKRAVPAILTGAEPHDAVVTPSRGSYPNNLFTWLHGSYRFNVHETLTDLCPEEACRRSGAGRSALGRELLTDLFVIYLHIVLPPQVARTHLAPLDTGWKGFGQEAQAGDDDRLARRESGSRAEQFQHFIDSITRGDKNTLHFIHILLPHVAYTYLPSGTDYLGGQTEGLLDKGLRDTVWTDDDVLPSQAYHRFLLQAGYVDRLVGTLVQRLKSEQLFDDALLIITSDHGKSFRPGQPKRIVTQENVADLLQVPLFVKVPGQRTGQIVERVVSNVDVLPTIAQVIGAQVPWQVDGRSLTDPSSPDRSVIELKALDGYEARRYASADVTDYPRHEWKLKTFGSRTDLATSFIASSFSNLIGKKVASLPVFDQTAHLQARSELFARLSAVEPSSGVVPAHFQGAIVAKDLSGNHLDLAIALNGRIAAVTRTTRWDDQPYYFSTMLPEGAFTAGENTVDIFAVRSVGGQVELGRVSTPRAEAWRFDKDQSGQEILVSGRRTIPIRDKAVQGHLDSARRVSGSVALHGWAVDFRQERPVTRVVVFLGNRSVYAAEPRLHRKDVASFLKMPDTVLSGYSIVIPLSTFGAGDRVRIFGITADGAAGELVVGPEVIADLDAMR